MDHVISDHIRAATLIHIPHSSTTIPSRVGYLVSEERLMEEVNLLTDLGTDILFKVDGIEHLICPWSRVFCDVERFVEGEEMEAVGMGYAYTSCDDGTPLRSDTEEVKSIALGYYKAHHAALAAAVRRKVEEEGHCYIIDAHSFSEIPLHRERDQSPGRADICLGTVTQGNQDYADYLKRHFESYGFTVALNKPYSGSMVPTGFINDNRVSSTMIEVNKRILGTAIDFWNLKRIIDEAFELSDLNSGI